MVIGIDNIEVNYFVSGPESEEAVVMLHGWGANIELFRNAAALISTKYKVAAPDMPGFGETPEPPAEWTVDDYTDFAVKFISALGLKKVILLGHSFGGATVRTFVSLMAQGSEEEMAATNEAEISPFFTGGKADWIYSVITLAAPHNGTTAYNIDENSEDAKTNPIEDMLSNLVSVGTKPKEDSRIKEDYAAYDMYIDNALELNEKLALPENIYYFSIACSATEKNEDGTYSPINSKMETLFRSSSALMGAYTGKTEKGFVIDESWRENDGLVNTCSALYPLGQPHTNYTEGNVQKGTWNVMPIYYGDHMSLQGGLFVKNDVRVYHAEMMNMINCLAK